jgi:WXG100 family type VII secretion target
MTSYAITLHLVEEISGELTSISNQVEGFVENIQKTVTTNLLSEWSGAASAAYTNTQASWSSAASTMQTQAAQCNALLPQILEAYYTAENKNRQLFEG